MENEEVSPPNILILNRGVNDKLTKNIAPKAGYNCQETTRKVAKRTYKNKNKAKLINVLNITRVNNGGQGLAGPSTSSMAFEIPVPPLALLSTVGAPYPKIANSTLSNILNLENQAGPSNFNANQNAVVAKVPNDWNQKAVVPIGWDRNAVNAKEKNQLVVAPKENNQLAVVPKENNQQAVVPQERNQVAVFPKGRNQIAVNPKKRNQLTVVPKERNMKAVVPREKNQKAVVPREKNQKAVVPREKNQKAVVPKGNNQLAVPKRRHPKRDENKPSTSGRARLPKKALVSARNDLKQKKCGIVRPIIINFRSTQVFRQEPHHQRMMRLYPAVRCYTKFEGVFQKINLYNKNDSTDLFNMKVDHLIKGIRNDCKNRVDVLILLRLIFNHCLHNITFARNVAPFFSTMKFYKFHLYEVNITRKFFLKLQYAFLDSTNIRSENKEAFYNIISFTGDCYNRLMSSFDNPYHLENYLIEYLQMLVETHGEVELKMFALEVYRNGKNLCQKYWIRMSHLFLHLRAFQIYNTSIGFNSKIWVMLALDLYSHSYELPGDLYAFYKVHLKNDIFNLVKVPETNGSKHLIPMEICEPDPEDSIDI